jgi:hypothetical protein
MTLELDTAAAAIVRDHPFAPRLRSVNVVAAGRYDRSVVDLRRDTTRYPPNAYLCQVCNLAEAAHASTTLNHDHEGTG